jgi:hypothetical protein
MRAVEGVFMVGREMLLAKKADSRKMSSILVEARSATPIVIVESGALESIAE